MEDRKRPFSRQTILKLNQKENKPMKANQLTLAETQTDTSKESSNTNIQKQENTPAKPGRFSIMKFFTKPEPKKNKILIVDDEDLFRNTCSMILEEAGCETTSASNTHEAMHLMESSPADVVLLDVEMPDEDGLTFLKRFKVCHPNVPVVILTGRGYDDDLMQTALERHASAYMSKNTDIEIMMLTIKQVIKQQQQ